MYEVLRVVRTVHRAESVGAAAGRTGAGSGGFNYYSAISSLGLIAVATGQPELLADLAATLYRKLGIDPDKEYVSTIGPPVKIGNNGKPLEFLMT